MAGEQFVFVVLPSRNKIYFFAPRSHLAVCPFLNTHPFSAVGFSELWKNKEVLPPPTLLEGQAYTPLPCWAGGPEHERDLAEPGGRGAENETLEDASHVPYLPATGAN